MISQREDKSRRLSICTVYNGYTARRKSCRVGYTPRRDGDWDGVEGRCRGGVFRVEPAGARKSRSENANNDNNNNNNACARDARRRLALFKL